MALWWITSLYHAVLTRTMSVQNLGQLVQAQMWASFVSAMLVPFLAAGQIVWVAYRRARA